MPYKFANRPNNCNRDACSLFRLCYYTIESLACKQRFLSEIRLTFGLGGFNCSFSERELSDFHNFLEKSFNFKLQGNVKVGATCVGRQTDDSVWILNEAIHINSNGELIPLQDSHYVWPGVGGPCIETVFGKNQGTRTVDIKSKIHLPLESKNCLSNLIEGMTAVLKHNAIAGKNCGSLILRMVQ